MLFPRIARLTITALLLGAVIAAPVPTDPKGGQASQPTVHTGSVHAATHGAHKPPHDVHTAQPTRDHIINTLASAKASATEDHRTWKELLEEHERVGAAIRATVDAKGKVPGMYGKTLAEYEKNFEPDAVHTGDTMKRFVDLAKDQQNKSKASIEIGKKRLQALRDTQYVARR